MKCTVTDKFKEKRGNNEVIIKKHNIQMLLQGARRVTEWFGDIEKDFSLTEECS